MDFVLPRTKKIKVNARAHKMSKSRGNVVNPDDIIRDFGADSLRLYEMFMGPLRETKLWRTKGVEGCSRFLARSYRLFDSCTDQPPTDEQLRTVHKCIAKVTEETENLRFNTAIAAMMEFTNAGNKMGAATQGCPQTIRSAAQSICAPRLRRALGASWQPGKQCI